MGTLGTIACNFVCLRSYGLLNLKLNKMKEPKRYYCGNGEGMFEDDKNGHWVEYSEHKAIVEALTKQLKQPPIKRIGRWKCMLCGRDKFTHKSPHKCVGGFRKRKIIWQELS